MYSSLSVQHTLVFISIKKNADPWSGNELLHVLKTYTLILCRSHQPRDLRHELSSLARTLGSWVRMALKAWMFGVCMCLFCVCVVLCLGRGFATSWSPVQESYHLWKMITELNKKPGPWMGWKSHRKKNINTLVRNESKCQPPQRRADCETVELASTKRRRLVSINSFLWT
jgi:hypothetical protein